MRRFRRTATGYNCTMAMLLEPVFWIQLGAIIWINLLVSGDNAVMIGLAARSLPRRQQKLAVLWGSAAAVFLRLVLTLFAVALLELPWLKLVGGTLLLWVGVKLLEPNKQGSQISAGTRLRHAIGTILVADLIMSTDNVIAVAAAANAAAPTPELAATKYALLILGLAISIPIVIFGSVMMVGIMQRFRVVILVGAALLGWIACDLMVTDPAVAGWIASHAFWLRHWHVAALAGAVLVTVFGIRNRRAARQASG